MNAMCVTGHKVFLCGHKLCICEHSACDSKLPSIGMLVPVTTAWRVLRLGIEVTANILNKQPRIADRMWSSSLGVGRVADESSP